MTDWRLLLTGPGEPGFNMALDEALAIAVRRGWSPPTLRIYRWQSPAVSLGCHQPVSVLEAFQRSVRAAPFGPAQDRPVEAPLAVVRRPTAGGAVRHAHDVSYALVCGPAWLRGRPGRALYRAFHAEMGRVLETVRPEPVRPSTKLRPNGVEGRTGLDVRYRLHDGRARLLPATGLCFEQPIADDLMLGPCKVAGAAQRRWRDGLLQQGTVAVPGCSPDRVALGIRTAWAEVFRIRFTVETLTVQERVLADELWSHPWTPLSWPPAIPSASNRSR